MKPAPFSYHRARSVEHAAELLETLGGQARILAGGQSLLPMLNMRLVAPAHLVDIGAVDGLGHIRHSAGAVIVGAAARQSDVEHSGQVRALVPLLAEAVRFVAHPPIRHRGTVVGSLAHASAVAELPCVALALDARFTVVSAEKVRTLAAADFFVGPFQTALEPGELVADVRFPVAQRGHGQAWSEFTLRRGNFPVAGAAVSLRLRRGVVDDVAIALCGVADRPVRASAAEKLLRGQAPSPEIVSATAEVAIAGLKPRRHADRAAHILPVPAAPTPAWAYRVTVAKAQVRKALTVAASRAGGTS